MRIVRLIILRLRRLRISFRTKLHLSLSELRWSASNDSFERAGHILYISESELKSGL